MLWVGGGGEEGQLDAQDEGGLYSAASTSRAARSPDSMAVITTAFAWVLTRPIVQPIYRTVLIPALGAFGLMLGLWYAGVT